MSSEQTNQQERVSAWFFHKALNENKHWNDVDTFMKDGNGRFFEEAASMYPALKPLKNPKADQKSKAFAKYWLECYFVQTGKMLERFSKKAFTSFNHGEGHTFGKQENPSFMEWVTKVVNKKYGIDKKDSWDPADIWCIRDLQGVLKVLKKVVGPNPEEPAKDSPPLGSIDRFNAALVGLYRNGRSNNGSPAIVGISLKLVGKKTVDDVETYNKELKEYNQNPLKSKTKPRMKKVSIPVAHYEEVNLTKSLFKSQEFIEGCVLTSIYIDLGFGKDFTDKTGNTFKTFNTQDTKISIANSFNNDSYSFQIKPNGTSDFNNLKFEPSPDGKGAARLGKAPLNLVDSCFRTAKLGFTNTHVNYPKDLKSFNTDAAKYTEMWSYLHTAASTKPFKGLIDSSALGNDSKTFISNIKKGYKVQPQIAMSKLMQLDFVYKLVKLGKSDPKQNEGFNKMNTLLTDMVFLAQKKNRNASMHFGPFGKIY